MLTTELDRWLWVDRRRLDTDTLERVLTVTPDKAKGFDEADPLPIPVYSEERLDEGFIGIPIYWGLNRIVTPDEKIIDNTTHGTPFEAPSRPDPNHPNAPEGQAEFMQALTDEVKDSYSVLAIADTGTGKTVCGVNTAAEIGRSTVVVVPTEQIGIQWAEAAQNFLGLKPHQIGWLRGDQQEVDRAFVVAMLKSVAMRDYQEDLYKMFGVAAIDEVHRLGAQMMRKGMCRFHAAYKFALTATKKRKDNANPIYEMYYGPGQVQGDVDCMPCNIRVMKLDWKQNSNWTPKGPTQMAKYLSSLHARNNWIVDQIIEAWEAGRHCLILSHLTNHCELIIEKLIAQGIDKDDIGQFTGECNTEIRPGEFVREKVSLEYLEWCKQTPSIVVGTYGMLKEGTDMPRMDWGMDATPASTATQVIGRIRRQVAGKSKPVWVTPLDWKVGPCNGYFKSRMKDYEKDPLVKVIHVRRT